MRNQILKLRNRFLILMAVVLLYGVGITANASVSGQYDYGAYVLACSLSYSNHKATGTTSGAPTSAGYNHVIVYSRNSSGQAVELKTDSKRIVKASATTDYNSKASYANSYHSIVDANGSQILPPINQIVLTD